MADTTALKNRIRAAIKANNNQEITGPVLQQTLLDIVDELDLNPELENEAQQRQSGDNTLQQAINTERQARIDADNALGQRITEEKNRAEGAESTLQQNINAEAMLRQEGDTQLNNLITGIKNNIDNDLATLSKKVYKNYYITEIGSINGENGSDATVTFRVRTNYIPSPCKIEVDSQYYIRAAFLYDGVKGTFVKALMDRNSDKSICSYYARDSGYVRFVISKNDDSSIQEDYLEPISSIDTLDILRLNQEIYKIQYSNIEYSLGGINGDNGNFINVDTRLRSSLIRTPALVKVDTKYRAVNCIEYSYNNDRLVFVEQIPIYQSPFDYNIIRIDKIALCRLTFKKDGNAVFDKNEKPIIGYYNEVGTYQFKNDVELISLSMQLRSTSSDYGNFIAFSSNRRVLNFVKADCNIILNDGYTIKNVTLYDYNFNVVKELFGYTNTFFDYKKGQISNDEYVRVTIAKDDNTNFTDKDNLIKYISSNGIVLSYNINMKSVSIHGNTGEEVTNTTRKTTDIINTFPCILSVNDDFFVKGIQLYKNKTWIAQNYFGSDVTLKSVRMTESSEYDGVRIVIAKNDESAFTDSDVNIIRNLLYLNDASEEVYNNL